MDREDSRVPFGRKLAFAVGDIFGGGSFNIVNFLYPGYLALIVGLPAAWAGVVMMIARIWDGIIDPFIGRITDATHSPMGKRRIYILISAPLIILAMVLLFYPYAFESLAVRFIVTVLSYIFFCTIQSFVMIPYLSLSSEMAVDYTERARINSLRLGFSIFSSILCVAVPGMVVDAFKNAADPLGKQGYIAMSLIFGTIFCLCLLATALGAREQIITPPARTKLNVKAFVRPLTLRSFRQYLGMQMCLNITMAIMSGLFFLYVNFYLMRDAYAANGSSGMVGMLGAAIMFAMQIVGLPFYLWLIRRRGKTFAYRLGGAMWILTALAVLLLRPGMPTALLYVLAALMGFGISGPGLVPHTMFGDVNDAGEVLFGQRQEGAFGGLANFINTLAQALGIWLVFTMLGAAGFVEQEIGAAQILSQPESAQLALKLTMCLSPLIFMGLGMLISLRYRISARKQQELVEMIHRQQEAESPDTLKSERHALIDTL